MDCLDRAIKSLGLEEKLKDKKKLMRDVRRRLGGYIRRMKEAEDLYGPGAVPDSAVGQRILEEIGSIRAEAVIKKNLAVKNAEARMRMIERRRAGYADSPEELIRSLAPGSMTDRPFAKHSAANVVAAAENSEHAQFVARIHPVEDYFGDPRNDPAITEALWHLNSKAPDQQALARLDPRAVESGRIVREFQQKLLAREKAAGGYTGTMEHFVTSRHHDPVAVSMAAGTGVTDPVAHSRAWRQFLLERIDREESFPGVADDELDEILSRTWNTMTSRERVYDRPSEASGQVPGLGSGNIAKSLAHRRVFRWKSPQAEFEYFQRFGGGYSLLASVETGIRRRVRDIALMELLGPSPRENLDRFISDLGREYGRIEGEGSARLEAIGKAGREAGQVLDYLEGKTTRPVNARLAKAASLFRAGVSGNALVRAGIAPLADSVFHGLTHLYYGDGRATSFGQVLVDSLRGFVRAWTTDFKRDLGQSVAGGEGRFSLPERQLLSKLAVYTESLANLSSQVGEHSLNEAGYASSIYRFMFRWNRLQAVTERSRAAIARAEAHGLAQLADVAFDKLPEGTKRFLQHGGLGPDDWDALRQSKITMDGETPLLTLEAADALTHDQVKNHARYQSLEGQLAGELADFEEKGRAKLFEKRADVKQSALDAFEEKVADLRAKHEVRLEKEAARIKRDITNGLTVMFNELQMMASNEPGVVDRMSLRLGNPGTVLGELADTVLMYKSFALSVFRRHLGRMVYGYARDGKMKMPRMMDMAALVAGSLVFGYAQRALKEMARNHSPPVPQDMESTWKIMASSFAQAGGVPIIGDFLFSDQSRYGRTPLTEALGPGAGTISDAIQIANKVLMERDLKGSGRDVFRLITRNAPGFALGIPGARVPLMAMNHAYTQAVFNLLLGYHIDEYLSPGSLRREKSRLRKYHQAFLIEPRASRGGAP